MKTWRRRGVIALAAAFVATLLATAMMPVTLVVPAPPNPRRGVVDARWERVGQAAPTRIVVDQRGSGVTVVGAPTLAWPELASPSLRDAAASHGFRYDPATATYSAVGPAHLVLRGVFGDATIGIRAGTTAARVAVLRSGSGSSAGGELGAAGPYSLFLPSARATYQRTTAFLWRTPTFDLNPALVGAGTPRAVVAGRSVVAAPGETLTRWDIAAAAAAAALDAWGIVLLVIVVLAFGWVIGLGVDGAHEAGSMRNAVRMAGGVALAAVALNSLAYVLPVAWAAWAVVGSAAILVAWRLRRDGGAGIAAAARATAQITWPAALPAVVFMWPMLAWGLGYAGEYKTDLFEYASLGSIAHDSSLFSMQGMAEAQQAGPLTSGAGIAWRSVDSIAAEGLSTVLHLGTVAGLTLLGLVLMMLFFVPLVAVARDQDRGWWAVAAAMVAGVFPLFGGLFAEDYLSHYAFVALLPSLVVAVSLLAVHARRESGWFAAAPGLVLLLASVAAFELLVYPYFLAVACVGLTATLIIVAPARAALLRMGAIVAAMALALANFGLLTVLNYGQTTQYQEGLNAIAKGVLLGPFGTQQRVGLLVGLVPYQWRSYGVPANGAMGFPGSQVWGWAPGAVSPGLGAFALVGIAMIGLVVVTDWRASLRFPPFAGAVGIAIAWAIFVGYFSAKGDTYAALKGLWTGAALVPLLVATLRLRRSLAPLAVVVLVPAAILWMRTDLLDRSTWLISRASGAAATHHSAVQPDVDGARQALAGVVGTVGILSGPQPLSGTDRDRVAAGHVRAVLRDLDLPCVGECTVATATRPATSGGIACPRAASAIVVIGIVDAPRLCGHPRAYAGSVIEVYR